MDPKITTAVVTGAATIAAAVLVAIFQFTGKWREERRLARIGVAEADARIATSFVQLMSRAHARGEPVVTDGSFLEALLQTGLLADQLRANLGAQVQGSLDVTALQRVDMILDAVQIRTPAVGAAEQEAAMQAVVALGLQHSFLTYAALTGLRDRHAFKPVWNFNEAEKALKARIAFDARKFRPRRQDRPSYWFARG
ncbi:hypothetical protein [Streptomyces sp. CA-251247]|uniref:hypothetical protein n=1 Tax=Streptomyces sp. CA-251247 TaxID=3240062 RepID=UPI003D94C681